MSNEAVAYTLSAEHVVMFASFFLHLQLCVCTWGMLWVCAYTICMGVCVCVFRGKGCIYVCVCTHVCKFLGVYLCICIRSTCVCVM